jgi:2-polyprenyl-3-methyl-5-hydroxy-6-metoxy-1,4-benzoquinol methylase
LPGARRSLDVGCGGGYLVAALAGRGFDAYGVDMSRYAVTHRVAGTENLLLEGDLSALDGRQPFELITMMDVIEHLPDPVSAVRQAFSLLAAGGTLILLTPRYGGRLLARQGAEYVHFNSDHMYYFTEQTLSAVIRAATGLTPITADVLSTLQRWNALIPPEVRQKYTAERDSVIAAVTRP